MKKLITILVSLFDRREKGVKLAKGAKILPLASLKVTRGGSLIIGKSLINDNAFVCASGGKIELEDGVSINRNAVVVSKCLISIGKGSSIGPNVCIYDHNHKIDKNGFYKDEFSSSPVIIGKNVWIAANCTILKGTTIGDNCVIGAGCVVSGVVPPNTLVKPNRSLQFIPLHD